MPWMEWFAQKHPALVHVPVAAALLLPLPLLAAQRAGRGIRPWWTVSRYLAVFGLLGALLAVPSGFAWGRMLELIPEGKWLVPASAQGMAAILRRHQLLGLACVGLGAATLFAATRPRRDHESLGLWSLLFGCAWASAAALAGLTGGRMTHPPLPPMEAGPAALESAAAPPAPEPVPAPAVPSGPSVELLDYQRLEPLHAEPVRGNAQAGPHAGRWLRAWGTPEAAGAYRAGLPLPAGSRLVLASVEDRWGRPSQDQGPLAAVETGADGSPVFTYYWPRVPEARRAETDSQARVFWTGQDPHLAACRTCHGEGLSSPALRSRWTGPKKVTAAD